MESPSHLRHHGGEITMTLLAALVYCRTWEITDALVTLLLRVVHAIGARADRRVTKQLVPELGCTVRRKSMQPSTSRFSRAPTLVGNWAGR